MTLERFHEAADFYRRAGDYLLQNEAEHNLILGLCHGLMQPNPVYTSPPYLAAVTDGVAVLAAALRTPPHRLVLSRAEDAEAIAAIAHDLDLLEDTLPGVVGPVQAAKDFVVSWEGLTEQKAQQRQWLRIYQLDEVLPIRRARGCMRTATVEERDLLWLWLQAFNREAIRQEAGPESQRLLDQRLAEGAYVLWDDGGPVSMAAFSGATPHGMRVNAVYTPPEKRGRGYASSVVADLSLKILDSGRRYCFLYTDLKNPTSNHIYQLIGYRPVTDVSEYDFIDHGA